MCSPISDNSLFSCAADGAAKVRLSHFLLIFLHFPSKRERCGARDARRSSSLRRGFEDERGSKSFADCSFPLSSVGRTESTHCCINLIRSAEVHITPLFVRLLEPFLIFLRTRVRGQFRARSISNSISSPPSTETKYFTSAVVVFCRSLGRSARARLTRCITRLKNALLNEEGKGRDDRVERVTTRSE